MDGASQGNISSQSAQKLRVLLCFLGCRDCPLHALLFDNWKAILLHEHWRRHSPDQLRWVCSQGLVGIAIQTMGRHGQSMQMSAAGLWIIFVERPLFLIVNQVAYGLGMNLDTTPDNPISYREKTFGVASLLSMCICLSVGAWRAYYDMPTQRAKRSNTVAVKSD